MLPYSENLKQCIALQVYDYEFMPFDLNRSVASARALRRVVGRAEYEPSLLHEFNHIEFIEEFLCTCDEIYSHLRKLGSMCSPNAESPCHALTVGNRIIYIIFLLESRKSILYACYARTSSYLSKEQYSDHVRQNTVLSGVSRGFISFDLLLRNGEVSVPLCINDGGICVCLIQSLFH